MSGRNTLLQRALKRMGYVPARRRQKSLRTVQAGMGSYHREYGIEKPENMNEGAYAYSVSSWLYACVDAKAIATANIPVRAMRRLAEGAEQVDSTFPLAALLRDVSPIATRFALWEGTSSYLDLMGNCYWDISEKGPDGRPTAIYFLEPQYVKIIPDAENFIGGYIYEVNGKKVRYEPDEVIHFKNFNPGSTIDALSIYYGLSPISALRISMTTDFYAQAHNKNFFKNGAKIGGVFETEEDLGDDAFERLKAQIEAENKGVDRAHNDLILENGLKYHEVGVNPKDMEFLDQRKFTREEICAVMGVPPALVGIFEYANYANAEMQHQSFYQKKILPRYNKIIEQLNQDFCPLFGSDIFLELDTSAVKELQEDENRLSIVRSRYVMRGILTINEIREEMNRGPVPWGDEDPRQGNDGNLMIGEGDKAVKSKGVKASESVRKERMNIGPLIKLYEKPVGKMLDELLTDFHKWLKSEGRISRLRAFAEQSERDAERDAAIVDTLFNGFEIEEAVGKYWPEIWQAEIEAYNRSARFAASKLARLAGKAAGLFTQKAIKEFELADQNILDELALRENLIKDATDSQFAALKDILRKHYFESYADETDAELLGKLMEILGNTNLSRIEAIARTECNAISNRALRDMFYRSGVNLFEWEHSGNADGRPAHMSLDGTVIDISKGETFSVNGYAAIGPHDSSLPPSEVVNCGCTTVPAVNNDYSSIDLWTGR